MGMRSIVMPKNDVEWGSVIRHNDELSRKYAMDQEVKRKEH